MSKDESLSALEREIEETRERLATTIDQLLYRAHPKTIVEPRGQQHQGALRRRRRPAQPRTDNILKVVGGVVGVVVRLRGHPQGRQLTP